MILGSVLTAEAKERRTNTQHRSLTSSKARTAVEGCRSSLVLSALAVVALTVARIAIVKPDKAREVGDMLSQRTTHRSRTHNVEARSATLSRLIATADGRMKLECALQRLRVLTWLLLALRLFLVSCCAVGMAQRGQVSSKIDEDRLKGMLTGLEGGKKETKIKFHRKTRGDDADDDDYSDP